MKKNNINIPDDFEWETYCNINGDLWGANIRTKIKAENHWKIHGFKENRQYKFLKKKILIPKIFHVIWVGSKKNPNKENITSWTKHNPGWRIQIWGNDDISPENFSNYEYILKANKPAQKADIMRYEIMYKYGGIYVDTDFECFKNIEELLYDKLCILCHEDEFDNTGMTNAMFGSIPGHDIFKYAIENIKNAKLNTIDVNIETGPIYLKNCVNKSKMPYSVIQSRLFYPSTPNEHWNHVDVSQFIEKAYAMHKWNGSWLKEDGNFDQKYNENDQKYYIVVKYVHSENYEFDKTSANDHYNVLRKSRDVNMLIIDDDIEKITITDKNGIKMEINDLKSINVRNSDIIIFYTPHFHSLHKYFETCTNKIYYYVNDSCKPKICTDMQNGSKYFETSFWIPNTVNTNNFVNYQNRNLDVKEHDKEHVKFIYVGNIQYCKNVHTLIEIFNALKTRWDISLTLVGENLDNIDTKYDGITHISHIDKSELLDIYINHDIYICLSETKSLPLSHLEAGGLGLCCIISDIPGMRDIFDDDVFYVKNYIDVDKSVNEIEDVLKNNDEINKTKQRIQERISKQYSENNIIRFFRVLEL